MPDYRIRYIVPETGKEKSITLWAVDSIDAMVRGEQRLCRDARHARKRMPTEVEFPEEVRCA